MSSLDYLPRLLRHLRKSDYIPLPLDRLAEELKIADGEREAFKKEVNQHLRAGTLVKLKKNRICLPRDADLVSGTIRFRPSGSAQIFPDTIEPGEKPDLIPVAAEDTGLAMHGDRIVARLQQDNRRWRRQRDRDRGEETVTARVLRVLEQRNQIVVGTLRSGRSACYVIPDDPRLIHDILVPDPRRVGNLQPEPKLDDKVVVKLAPWEHRHLNPEGEVIEVLGKTHTPMAEYAGLLRQYQLDLEFPPEVMDEVEVTPTAVTREQKKHRVDLTRTRVMTIDPQDAKDFDDALSLERLEDGRLKIGVHIADVSTYVTPGSALDREARRRGNSTYLVGGVVPMLPHALSNGICSLVEGEDRLVKSVFLTYTARGKLEKTDFRQSVIRSQKRFTYEQAYALLKHDDLGVIRKLSVPPAHQTGSTGRPISKMPDDELRACQEDLRAYWQIAKVLRDKRFKNGSLDLDMPETKIYVDEDGYADRLIKIEHDESHQLIEEFALAANEAVAKALNKRRLPAIHRVHDKPDPDKLADFSAYLETVGIVAGDLTDRQEVMRVLAKVSNHPQGHVIRVQFLRSLKSAHYRASADGHYGLAKQHYLHFTSPIRRYSDLICHRLFVRYLLTEGEGKVKRTKNSPAYDVAELVSLARHLTLTEQNSTDAERDSQKVKLLEFFERELAKAKPQRFEAVIVEVRNHGMFVELTESLAYGLVHVSTLRDDLYRLNPTGTALIGRRSRKLLAVGETIWVIAHKVDRFKKQVDFAMTPPPPGRKRR